jgi:S1-C subfamily serine protease
MRYLWLAVLLLASAYLATPSESAVIKGLAYRDSKPFTELQAPQKYSAPQKVWGVKEINATIANTNFVVDGHCSGTLISSELRLVLTNFHCIDEAVVKKRDVQVWQTRTDEFEMLGKNVFEAKIVAMNKAKDTAVVQIKDPSLKKVPVARVSFKYERGEDVWIIGNPVMLEASVVKGIMSNRNRVIPMSVGDQRYMQFSGGIIGGNSGGSLYNQYGELLGIPSAGYRNATFLGFGIPMEVVMETLRDNCIDYVEDKFVETKTCPGGSKLLKK